MLSIVIPTYNASGTLPKLLDSIFKPGQPSAKREVIVTDDGSTDDTLEVAARWPVKILQGGRRAGPAAARNRGAREARGDVLLFLDADTVIAPGTLAYIERRFAEEPSIGCLMGIYGKRPLNGGLFPRYKALLAFYWFRNTDRMESFETSCGAVRKRLFEAAGGFDERFADADVEDYEMGYRLGRLCPMVLDRRIQVGHHFPGFCRNLKNFYRRGRMWTALFLGRRRFDSAGSSAGEGFTRAAGGLVGLCLALTLLFPPLWPLAAASGLLYLGLAGPFLFYCAREGGPLFLLPSLFFHLANSTAICAAAGAALLETAATLVGAALRKVLGKGHERS